MGRNRKVKCRSIGSPRRSHLRRKNRKCYRRKRGVLKTKTYFYYALGDGAKRAFKDRDGIPGYSNRIPSPRLVSFTQVFIDGLLQSPRSYRFCKGRITFTTRQVPVRNARVIAQFIAIRK